MAVGVRRTLDGLLTLTNRDKGLVIIDNNNGILTNSFVVVSVSAAYLIDGMGNFHNRLQ